MKKKILNMLFTILTFMVGIVSSYGQCWFTELLELSADKKISQEYGLFVTSSKESIVSFEIAQSSGNKALLELDNFKKFNELSSRELKEAVAKLEGEGSNSLTKQYLSEADEGKRAKILSEVDNVTAFEIANKKGVLIGKFERGLKLELLDVTYELHGGNVINLSPNKTTTITGVLEDVNEVGLRGISGKELNGITAANVSNPGGINILRSPKWKEIQTKYSKNGIVDWTKVSDEFWETVNKPWLDEAIKRGDNIRMVSDPKNPLSIYVTDKYDNFILNNNGDKILSIFGREIEYLQSKGYTILENGVAIKK